ncbi:MULTISPECIES: disulfide bond formation protein DsbA [unclassified Amycolatopsis]|uniref:mycothiol-dependent nitroreductase Rv2466c family protein n=1 Tax=unclassified Amycolatopsis TaxID=2618356 RepID=UPI00106E8CB7|nr:MULTISPECIES: disulfide bond formation protein DsbA [unclassified Amycolatopsis]
MTDVVLYGDPVCPFAWLAYRWLADTGAEFSVRPMSLAVLNEGNTVEEGHRQRVEDSLHAGRVRAAIADPAAAARFHVALGRRIHEQRQPLDSALLRAALRDAELPEDLAQQANSTDADPSVRRAHQESQDALGETGGSPITAIDGRAFFGPVLTELPAPAEGRSLLDALRATAAVPAFAEFRRPRTGTPTIPEG